MPFVKHLSIEMEEELIIDNTSIRVSSLFSKTRQVVIWSQAKGRGLLGVGGDVVFVDEERGEILGEVSDGVFVAEEDEVTIVIFLWSVLAEGGGDLCAIDREIAFGRCIECIV